MFTRLSSRLPSESGFTLVELIVVCATMGIVLAGLANIFVSGERVSQNDTAQLSAQEDIRTAFSRLEYEARCASSAALVSGGAGVALSIPTQCTHSSSRDIAWCVQSGSLLRIAGSTDCTGSGQTLAADVTSATPFSCNAPTGTNAPLPQVDVDFTANSTGRSQDTIAETGAITMRNAAAGACS